MTDVDEAMIRESARGFLARQFPSDALHRALDAPPIALDRDGWSTLAQQGWLGMTVPPEYGGLGMPLAALCIVAEEMGRALVPLPFCATAALTVSALAHYGSADQQARWLPRIARGEVAATLAYSEGPGDSGDLPRTRARAGSIHGIKMPVLDGMSADIALLLARDGRGVSLFLAELSGPGVTRELLTSLDPTRPPARIAFDGAPAERLGPPGDGAKLLAGLLDEAIIALAFEQIGGAQRCLDAATAYASERYAFGRLIGSFQAIRHKLADIYIRIEVARLNAEAALLALDQRAPDASLAAASARIAASDAYWQAAKENIQVHGGIGFTWEMDCHLFYRRSKLLAVSWGSAARWGERLASTLLALPENEQ